jgi:hypothetical protein
LAVLRSLDYIAAMSLTRRALIVGAAAVPVAMALPFDVIDPEAAEIERMVAELRRDLMAISLAPCPALPEGPVTLCGGRMDYFNWLDCGTH